MYQLPLSLVVALTQHQRDQIVVATMKSAIAAAFAVVTYIAKKEYDRARER